MAECTVGHRLWKVLWIAAALSRGTARRVRSYAQQHGYTLVLDVAQQQTPVLYATESTNITKAVIDAYNVKSGVPAPPAPAAGAASAPKAPSVH